MKASRIASALAIAVAAAFPTAFSTTVSAQQMTLMTGPQGGEIGRAHV